MQARTLKRLRSGGGLHSSVIYLRGKARAMHLRREVRMYALRLRGEEYSVRGRRRIVSKEGICKRNSLYGRPSLTDSPLTGSWTTPRASMKCVDQDSSGLWTSLCVIYSEGPYSRQFSWTRCAIQQPRECGWQSAKRLQPVQTSLL